MYTQGLIQHHSACKQAYKNLPGKHMQWEEALRNMQRNWGLLRHITMEVIEDLRLSGVAQVILVLLT